MAGDRRPVWFADIKKMRSKPADIILHKISCALTESCPKQEHSNADVHVGKTPVYTLKPTQQTNSIENTVEITIFHVYPTATAVNRRVKRRQLFSFLVKVNKDFRSAYLNVQQNYNVYEIWYEANKLRNLTTMSGIPKL